MIDEKVRGGFFKFQIISSATLSRKIRHGKMAMTAFLKPAPFKDATCSRWNAGWERSKVSAILTEISTEKTFGQDL